MFCHICWFFKISQNLWCAADWKIIKCGKKWRKSFTQLVLNPFLHGSTEIRVSGNRIHHYCLFFYSRPENLKKSRPKKLVKSNNSILRKNILTKIHFLQFQKWPKINFWTAGKKFAKNAISRKNFLAIFDFTSFFAWTF